jgi:hypothetical protein
MQPRSPALEILHCVLNEMWQQDRAECTPGQLAAYSRPLDLESDPEFRIFLKALDKAFE